VKGYDYEWEKWEYEAPYYYEELFPNVGSHAPEYRPRRLIYQAFCVVA
jgi:hypothetical protein